MERRMMTHQKVNLICKKCGDILHPSDIGKHYYTCNKKDDDPISIRQSFKTPILQEKK